MTIRSAAAAAGMLLAGAFVCAGTNVWTEPALEVGDVRAEFSSDPLIAFARAGDKFYKSNDGGLTWTAKLTDSGNDTAFAVDPSNPNIVVVNWDDFNALRRSTDGGETFTAVSTSIAPELLQFSEDGSRLYGVTFFEPYVRYSTNRGATWSSTPNVGLPAPPPSGVLPVPHSIAIHRTNTSTIYVGFNYSDLMGIYKSTDGGANWSACAGTLNARISAIALSPANSEHVYAATSIGLMRSLDGGASWANVPDPTATGVATIALQSVAFDRASNPVIYAGGAERGEIFRSANGGASWERRGQGVLASRVNSLSVRPGSNGELLAGTSHTVYRTFNAGQAWDRSASGLHSANVTALNAGSRLRVGLLDGGVYESLDGDTWTPLNNEALRARQPAGTFGQVTGISEPGKLFVLMDRGLLTWSTDNGSTWAPRPQSFNRLNNFVPGGFLTLNGSGPMHLATSSLDVEVTSDDGLTWSVSDFGLPQLSFPKVLVKNADASVLYLGTAKGVYKSVNGGGFWSSAQGNLPANADYVQSLAYDDASGALLVGTLGGAFVTRDGGTSYTALAPVTHPHPGTLAGIQALVVEDFEHGSIYLASAATVFRSVDRGASWTALTAGASPSPYRYVTTLTNDGPGVLYAGYMNAFQRFTVAPDIQLVAGGVANGAREIGTQVPWGVTVRNNGPHAATFAYFEWQAPPTVTLLAPTTSRGNCSVTPGNLFRCELGIMQPGDSADINVTIRGDAGGVVTLAGRAGAAELDPVPANNDNGTAMGFSFFERVDLGVALVASRATVNSGETFDYTLTLHNAGPHAATRVQLDLGLDPRDRYVLTTGSIAGCTGNVGGALFCTGLRLPANGLIVWRWSVIAVPPGARTAHADVRPAEYDGETNPADNSAQAALDVTAANDLELALASNSNAVARGTTVTYTLTTTNRGVIPAGAVTPKLTLGAGLTFASALGASCAATGNVVSCDVGTLAPDAAAAVAITVNTLAAGATGVTANVTGANPDPDPADNAATAALTVAPVADLGVTLASTSNSVAQSAAFAYTLTVSNAAASDSTTATARVTLSNLLTYASATGATCTHAAGVVTCNVGALAPGASLAVTINVTASTAGSASASASVEGAALDPVVTNNTAAAPAVIVTAPPTPPSSSSSSGGGKGGGALDFTTALALLGILAWARGRRARPRRA